MSALAGWMARRVSGLTRRVSGLACWVTGLAGWMPLARRMSRWVARMVGVIDVAVVGLAPVTLMQVLEVPAVISLALNVLR
jgi:hypothetical protein